MFQIETPRWYVVYAKPGKEEFVQCQMQRKGIGVFFPRLYVPVALSRRAKRQIVPLFPNYLFVHLQRPEAYDCIRWTPGVKYVVNFHGTPAPLDDAIIHLLRGHASPEGLITAHSTAAAGQQVQVSDGPFAGLAGVIQNPPNARGRVKVLLELLGRQVKVDLPVSSIESKWAID